MAFYDDQELLVRRPQGLLRLRADVVVLAMGGYEEPPPCLGNDLPGVMGWRAASAAWALGILPGRRVMVAAAPNAGDAVLRRARTLAGELRQAGALAGALELGADTQLLAVRGSAPNLEVHVHTQGLAQALPCDALVWCARPVPAYELARQMGIDTPFDPSLGGFVPVQDGCGGTARDGVFVAGELAGVQADAAAAHGAAVGAAVCRTMRLVDLVGLA